MINPDIITKFSGPPGTGKSTTLLNVVESLLSSGVDPEHIVYTTFTRAGAYEARDRACARFNLSPNRLPYFKTLHALCYSLLPSCDVMGPKDWAFLGTKLNLFFSNCGIGLDDGIMRLQTKGDILMSLWSLARLTQSSLDQVWAKRESYQGPEILRAEFDRFVEAAVAYKAAFGKIDYADMLEVWLKEGADMNADYLIVDEAQDLSALQWAVVEKLARQAKQVWVAGDDDQCIHEWNGAKPQHFIGLEARTYTVLPQSYRIPASVHAVAQTIIGRVKERLPKEYKPREEVGLVRHITSLIDAPLKQGTWMLLASTNAMLKEFEDHCQQIGCLYTSSNAESTANLKAIEAIQTWTKLSKQDEAVDAGRIKRLYPMMSQCNRVRRGFKTVLMKENDGTLLTLKDLNERFGMVTPKEMTWHQALDLMPKERADYLWFADHTGVFARPIRIRISTIHGAKGKEAEHIVLNLALSKKGSNSATSHPDATHRAFYVGVTRAKQSLYLLASTNERAYRI